MSRKMLIDGEMGSVEEGKQYDFDLFVIGAGSGGVRASRTSAAFGAKVAICELPFHPISSDEDGGVGGTCVIRGCVPKKILVYGSQFRCEFEDARNFGWELPEQIDFNWKKLLHNKVEDVQDKVQDLLKRIEAGEAVDDTAIADLSKRKLIEKQTLRGYTLAKGPKYVSKRKKAATDLTRENLQRGDWKDLEFKEYNLTAQVQPIQIGYVQPLLKVREEIENIFLEMGFEEMPTNNFVESSFWNFDALFQPQQHPARDSHDTFFLTEPATTRHVPEDYLERVKRVHESGDYGSKGYQYEWKREEADKNLLRTHTTAVSTRMLYLLAQKEKFTPKRYFSIDRVFRNEAVDRTHLAEFHQIEGLICDRGLTLGDLIGVLHDFFARLGMSKLKFKPAYNPYTEPSMEIFSYHEGLKKWVEIGNSGMFRPEMLLPMGLPEDVNVIAWGLSLERPTMILYGIDNIRDLFGTKIDFDLVKNNPVCRLGLR